MKFIRHVGGVLTLAAALQTGSALAGGLPAGIVVDDATAHPGDTAFVAFRFDYGGSIRLTVEELNVLYPAATLQLLLPQSSVERAALPTIALQSYLDLLAAAASGRGSFLSNLPVGEVHSSFQLSTDSVERSGSMTIRLAFAVASGAPSGSYPVSFSGVLSDDAFNEQDFSKTAFVNVAPVPEPAAALMLLAGLGVLGLAGAWRGSAQPRSRSIRS